MYTVVGCPECRALWTVEDRPETTRCPRCRTRHQFGGLKALAETETSEAAARARSALLAERADEGTFLDPAEIDPEDVGVSDEEFLDAAGVDVDAVDEAARRATESTHRSRSRRRVVRDALEELEEPTAERVRAYGADAGVPSEDVDEVLERLGRAGEVVERDGVYRLL